MDLASVEAALDALELDGARGFDTPACDCIRKLVTQAEQLGGAVADRLTVRAAAHLDALRAQMELDRARVTSELEALERQCDEGLPELHLQLTRGETTRVARTVRRLRARPRRPAKEPSTALARTEQAPQTQLEKRTPSRIAVRQKQALAYEDSVAALVASFALARAVDVVPEDAGPYNALRIASEALDRMRAISPFYLTVQLNRLEELASLLSLPELPKSEPATPAALPSRKSAPPARKKRSALKGGS